VTTATLPVHPQLRELWLEKVRAEPPRVVRRRRHIPAVVFIYAGLFLGGFGTGGAFRLTGF